MTKKIESLYDILIKFGVPKTLVRLVKTCSNGTQSKVRIRNYLSSSFPIENDLKQGDSLAPKLFNFSLEYAVRKVQETNLEVDTNDTHQVFAYADDVRTIEINADILLNACKDIGLAVKIPMKK
jgi:Reverse transcriptase (RNA-dependent DNA polymerase).